jgi:uncharacterized protein with HEPN domain
MSLHDDDVRLRDMLSHAREAVEMCRGRARADLDTDRMLNLALVRLIEIIGEAANHVSDEGQRRFPRIPWPQVIGTRNRLIHGYRDIDFNILWDTIQVDLPDLITLLKPV